MRKAGGIIKKKLKVSDHDGALWAHGILSLGSMAMHTHFYIVDGLVLDTGPSRLGVLSRELFKEERVIRGAATHFHEDHTGIAPWLTKEMKIPFYLQKNDIEKVKSPTKLPLYRALAWGNREGFTAEPFPEVLETDKHKFRVIEAPGHSDNHVVFHEPNKGWLLTGDLYVSSRQRVAFVDEHMGQAMNTLEMILNLDFRDLFCGHAGILTDGKNRIKTKLEILKEIQGRVMELHRKGLSIDEINKTLYPKKDLWFILSRGEWSSRKIVSTILEN